MLPSLTTSAFEPSVGDELDGCNGKPFRPRWTAVRRVDIRRVTRPTDRLAMSDLAASIRTIPDYPKPGIVFRDITTLLGDARAFRRAVDELVQPWAGTKVDKVAGI